MRVTSFTYASVVRVVSPLAEFIVLVVNYKKNRAWRGADHTFRLNGEVISLCVLPRRPHMCFPCDVVWCIWCGKPRNTFQVVRPRRPPEYGVSVTCSARLLFFFFFFNRDLVRFKRVFSLSLSEDTFVLSLRHSPRLLVCACVYVCVFT